MVWPLNYRSNSMTNQTTNIETFQTEVNEIAKDLADLKNETSETLKKNKAEAAADKLKTTKEEITKKIEALKWLTDANSQADIAKLETMLLTLESFGSEFEKLKIAITTEQSENIIAENEDIPVEDKTDKKEEKKGWFKRQREGVTSKEEWKEHTLNNVGRVAMWVWAVALVYKWVKWLFGLGKEKDKTWEKSEEKKEKKSRWKKTLLWAGIWTWGILAWKNWDKIKGWFSGLFGWWEKPNEWDGKTDEVVSSAKEFKETLSSEEKIHYNSFADNVNQFYAWWNGQMNADLINDQLWNSKFETHEWEKIQWLIPFMLNNRYKNIDSLMSEWTFYKEVIGTETESMMQTIQWWTADQIGAFLTPIASAVDGMLPALLNLKTTGKVDEFVQWLKWNADAQEVISMTFRKTIMVISYVNSKENSLKYTLAADYLTKQDPAFKNKSIEDQNEDIADQLKDEEFCKKNIDPIISKFRDGTLYEGIKLLEEYWCADGNLDVLTQEAVDDVNERKMNLLDEDDEGNNIINDIKENFEEEKLNKEGQEDASDLLDDFEEEIDDDWSRAWYNKYLPLMNFFDPSDDIMQKIMNTWDYDKIVKVYKDKISEIREKIRNGTVKPNDIDDLKRTIDDYYDFEKSLVTSQTNIEEVFDKNGNKKLRRWNVIWQSGQALWSGGEMLIEGKYIEWGLVTAWALVSLDISTYPIRLGIWLFRWKIASSPSTKAVVNIWKFTLKQWAKLTGKSLNLALRNYVPASISAKMYKGKDYVFRYELAKGNISLDKAVKIAKKNGIQSRVSGNIIATEDELVQRVAGIGNSSDDIKKGNLIKKYWNNKNILKQVIVSEYKGNWYAMAWRANKYNYSINSSALEELWNIDAFLWRSTHAGKSSLIKWFLETTKSLKPDMIDEIFKTQTFDAIWGKESKAIGKLLGKKMNTFSSLDDFKAFQWYFTRNYSKYPTEGFVRNSLSNRSKLSGMDDIAQAKYIETANLNVSRYERVANKVKSGVTNMIDDLNKMLKNPKMKSFYTGIKSKITNLTNYRKTVTPESIKAISESNWLDKIAGFGKLSPDGIKALQSLSVAIGKDKTIIDALSKATKLDDVGNIKWVKSILTEAGIDISKIDDGVLMKIAQTKKASKIESIINYGAEYTWVKSLEAVLKNPAMRSFGKWLWIVWVGVDAAFVGIDFVSDKNESEKIKGYNLARGKNKESEAYFDVITWGIWATLGAIWFINAWNPVWRVCLAWAWTAMWVEALGDLYYGEIDKFKQNYQDFLQKDIPSIKQNLIYINSRQTNLDSSFQDVRSRVTWNLAEDEKKKISVKTSSDAVKALIYFEEMQKYPYAMADLNSPEIRKNPDLEALVKQQKDLHAASVEERYIYIKKNYIDGKSNIVGKDVIEKNQWIQALDNILSESRIAQAVNVDENYTNKSAVKWYPKYLETELKKINATGFAKLETLSTKNPVHFYEILSSLWYYENLMNEYATENKEQLSANLDFLKKYAGYKMVWKWVSDFPKIEINKDTIDFDQITNLLLTFGLTTTGVSATEIGNENIEYLSDAEITEKYSISNNLWQNILYEIANKQLWYVWANNLADLKIFYSENKKETNWIYFDPGDQDRAINENNWSDNEFAPDAELNDPKKIIKMRGYIDDAANSSITWNMITGNDTANKEYAKKYIDIINNNLNYRLNPSKYKTEILQYIKTTSNGKYIQLPSDLLIVWTKAWIKNIWAFIYARDGKKIDAKTTKTWLKSELLQ